MLPVLANGTAADQQFRELWAVTSPLAIHAWIPGAACSLNCPNWSISTEAFFYLLFPFVFAPVYRRPGLAMALSCITMLIIWAWQMGIWLSFDRPLAAMQTVSFASDREGYLLMQLFSYLPLTRLPEFLLGIGLYGLWRNGFNRLPSHLLYGLAAAGALALLLAAPSIPENVKRTGIAAICFAPLILAAANTPSGLLANRVLIWLGQISFSLYLVHSPVDSYLRTIDRVVLKSKLADMPLLFFSIAIAISIICAAMLYHWLEEPARRAITNWFKQANVQTAGSEARP